MPNLICKNKSLTEVSVGCPEYVFREFKTS